MQPNFLVSGFNVVLGAHICTCTGPACVGANVQLGSSLVSRLVACCGMIAVASGHMVPEAMLPAAIPGPVGASEADRKACRHAAARELTLRILNVS